MARAATGSEMVGSGQGSARIISVPTCCAALGKSLALSEAQFPAHQRWANDWLGRQHLLGRGGGALIGRFRGRGTGSWQLGEGGFCMAVRFPQLLYTILGMGLATAGERGRTKASRSRPLPQLPHPLKRVVERPRTLFQVCRRALVYKGLHCISPCQPHQPLTTIPKMLCSEDKRRTSAEWEVGAGLPDSRCLPPPAQFWGGFTFFRSTGLRKSSPSTAP